CVCARARVCVCVCVCVCESVCVCVCVCVFVCVCVCVCVFEVGCMIWEWGMRCQQEMQEVRMSGGRISFASPAWLPDLSRLVSVSPPLRLATHSDRKSTRLNSSQ